MNKAERRENLFLNQSEIANITGTSIYVVMYHRRNGLIPKPTKLIGKKYFYTKEESIAIVKYFENREKYDHAQPSDEWKGEVRSQL